MTDTDPTLAAKKRMMFIKGEDFNYLAYNILIILDSLKCHSADTPFKDHSKLAYLVDLVSSPTLAPMLVRQARLKSPLSPRDLHSLSTAYVNGASRKHFIARLISSLITRGFVSAQAGERRLDLNLWLNLDAIPASFLSSDIYAIERENIKRLRSLSKLLRTLTLETLLAKFFKDHGVQVWHS